MESLMLKLKWNVAIASSDSQLFRFHNKREKLTMEKGEKRIFCSQIYSTMKQSTINETT